MLSGFKPPIKKIPLKTTLDIIQRASGKPLKEIKNFYQNLNTFEGKKVAKNSPYTQFSATQFKKLLQDTHKQGFFLSENKIKKELKVLAEQEKKHRIKYSLERSKLTERLNRLKGKGGDDFMEREIERTFKRRALSSNEKRNQRAERIHNIIADINSQKTKESSSEKKDSLNSQQKWIQTTNNKNSSDSSKKTDSFSDKKISSQKNFPFDKKRPLDLPID